MSPRISGVITGMGWAMGGGTLPLDAINELAGIPSGDWPSVAAGDADAVEAARTKAMAEDEKESTTLLPQLPILYTFYRETNRKNETLLVEDAFQLVDQAALFLGPIALLRWRRGG